MRNLVLFLSFFTVACSASKQASDPNVSTAIVGLMNKSAQDWNAGNLDAFMSLYDSESTFMMTNGPVGIAGMKDNYQKGFFDGKMPKQNLRYEEMIVRPLGKEHALLTGKFVLY